MKKQKMQTQLTFTKTKPSINTSVKEKQTVCVKATEFDFQDEMNKNAILAISAD